MSSTNNYQKCLRMASGVLVLVMSIFSLANAQEENLYRAPGKVVAEGHNTVPVSVEYFNVTTYSLEEVELVQSPGSRPVEAFVRGERRRIDKVLRLTISGDFLYGAYFIWIDDIPFGATKYGRNKIMVILYGDGGVLVPNATLAVSRYTGRDNLHAPRATLPETLSVPAEFQSLQGDNQSNNVKLRRVTAGVEIILEGLGKAERWISQINRAIYPVLQIGREEFFTHQFGGNRQPGALIFTLTPEEFASVKDGDRMLLKSERGPINGQKIGRLNKSLLKVQ